MSHRKRDSHVEKQVSDFLDCYFCPKIVKNFSRYHDKTNQLNGIDVFSIDNHKKLIVDEKAASHYINKDIPTFAFELSFLLPSSK